jgi:hypothetical protein
MLLNSAVYQTTDGIDLHLYDGSKFGDFASGALRRRPG